ncbi:hypothetical protein DMB92_03410 [Campylobacter sp. MIT 99-7217]|uniref:YhdP family protein n=1 Tax=Campylobacter sp. MIT 99-7217 TaxID=535091 RepID=UPI001158DAD4|nr:AsmA-like C-terminal domain-containing protein [Campylobacter sp. MIT 99-7217]TQR33020.1 hypothetical protein DMB92_03410 [Campylobacter sp. MIT 99-7217]
MKKNILRYLFIVFIIFLVLFIILKNGFTLSIIQTQFFHLEELYIKLDKKLIVKAKKIEIFTQEQDESFSSKTMLELSQNLEFFYSFFQEIDIENLHLKNQNTRLRFINDEFIMDNEHFFIQLGLNSDKNMIKANINDLFIKDYNASSKGEIYIDIDKEKYTFVGDFNSTSLYFDFNISYTSNEISYDLENINITNINAVLDNLKSINLSKGLVDWLGTKARAEFYHFDFLEGKVRQIRNKYQITDLKAKAYAQNLDLKLKPNIQSIIFPYVDLILNGQRLDFKFDKANFGKFDISQSKVYIYDILEPKKTGIHINIISNELLLDDKMQTLLKEYKINVPLQQLSGKMDTNFTINLPFATKKGTYEGDFHINKTKLDMASFMVDSGVLTLKNTDLSMQNFNIFNDFLKADFNASLNLSSKKGIFDTNISQIYFNNLLNLENKHLLLNFSYDNEVILYSKDFDLSINFTKGLSLQTPSLEKFKEYSPLMQKLQIQGADSFLLQTKDYKNFNIFLTNTHFNLPLFQKDQSPYNLDDFIIKKNGDNFSLQSASKHLSLNFKPDKKDIIVKDLSLKYTDELKFDTNETNISNLSIRATNSGIYFKDENFHFDQFYFYTNKELSNLKASRKNAQYVFDKQNNHMLFKAFNLDDEIINEIFNKTVVKGGNFNLFLEGNDLKDFEGRIYLGNTYLKDLKLYNQLISFIDTIPSLLMFKSPTFNEKGLNIQKGAVLLKRKDDIIYITGLNLDGDSVDILGSGQINLKDESIFIELELKTLKSASEIINKVPIINQVLLGKDREISTRIVVEGKLDNPKFKTQVIKETLKLPFNILKNIVEAPSTWFK